MSNSLHSDQDLAPNCLQRLSAEDSSWQRVYDYIYSHFMSVCSMVKTITQGAVDYQMHEAKGQDLDIVSKYTLLPLPPTLCWQEKCKLHVVYL